MPSKKNVTQIRATKKNKSGKTASNSISSKKPIVIDTKKQKTLLSRKNTPRSIEVDTNKIGKDGTFVALLESAIDDIEIPTDDLDEEMLAAWDDFDEEIRPKVAKKNWLLWATLFSPVILPGIVKGMRSEPTVPQPAVIIKGRQQEVIPPVETRKIINYSQEYFKTHGLELCKSLTETDLLRMKEDLKNNWGKGPAAFAEAFKNSYPVSKERLETIYRSERHRAEYAGVIERAKDAGHVYKQYRAVGDERTCDICMSYDMEIVPIDEPFSNGEMTPSSHPNCYSDDTEVFTENGWKLFKDVNPSEKIWTLNLDTKLVELDNQVTQISYEYSGDMIHFKNRTIDCLVTPDHSMVVQKSWDRQHNPNNPYKLVAAKDIAYGDIIPRSGTWKGTSPEYIQVAGRKFLTKDFMQFMGWYISEGSISKPPNGYWQIRISQQKEQYRQEIIELCNKLFPKTWVSDECIYIPNVDDIKDYFTELGHAHDKYVPHELLQLDSYLLKEFLVAFVKGDGSISKNRWIGHPEWNFQEQMVASSSSPMLINNLTEIALKVGLRPNFRIAYHHNGVYTAKYPQLHIDFGNRVNTHYNKSFSTVEQYSGMVYCLEMAKNHSLYVRRNGKANWAGNCRCSAITLTDAEYESMSIEFYGGTINRYLLKDENLKYDASYLDEVAEQLKLNYKCEFNGQDNKCQNTTSSINNNIIITRTHRDIPSISWLKGEREYAKGRQEKTGRPINGTVTSSFEGRLPVSMIKNLPGENKEHLNKKILTDYKATPIFESIKQEGVKEPVTIFVNYKGDAYISEGNHRTAIANAVGLKDIPVEVRYFAGGELVNGPWNMKNFVKDIDPKYLNMEEFVNNEPEQTKTTIPEASKPFELPSTKPVDTARLAYLKRKYGIKHDTSYLNDVASFIKQNTKCKAGTYDETNACGPHNENKDTLDNFIIKSITKPRDNSPTRLMKVELLDLPNESSKQITKHVTNLVTKEPLLQKFALTVKSSDLRDKLSEKESQLAYAIHDGSSITLNELYFGNEKAFRAILDKQEQSGWHPKGCNTPESVVTHEVGHFLMEGMEHKADDRLDQINEVITDAASTGELAKISRYADRAYKQGDIAEAQAEIYASVYHTPVDQQMPAVKKVSDILKSNQKFNSKCKVGTYDESNKCGPEKDISQKEQNVITGYIQNDNILINKLLSDDQDLTEEEQKIGKQKIEVLDNIFKKTGLHSDRVVYRGISQDNIKFLPDNYNNIGSTFIINTFQSTSNNRRSAESFITGGVNDKSILIKIELPKGSKAVSVGDYIPTESKFAYSVDESEVLINRNTKFEVVDYQVENTNNMGELHIVTWRAIVENQQPFQEVSSSYNPELGGFHTTDYKTTSNKPLRVISQDKANNPKLLEAISDIPNDQLPSQFVVMKMKDGVLAKYYTKTDSIGVEKSLSSSEMSEEIKRVLNAMKTNQVYLEDAYDYIKLNYKCDFNGIDNKCNNISEIENSSPRKTVETMIKNLPNHDIRIYDDDDASAAEMIFGKKFGISKDFKDLAKQYGVKNESSLNQMARSISDISKGDQNRARDDIYKAFRNNSDMKNAILLHIAIETSQFNPNRMLYRKGGYHKNTIESYTTYSKGANPQWLTNPEKSMGVDFEEKFSDLKKDGWMVLTGVSAKTGFIGENEIVLINMNDIESGNIVRTYGNIDDSLERIEKTGLDVHVINTGISEGNLDPHIELSIPYDKSLSDEIKSMLDKTNWRYREEDTYPVKMYFNLSLPITKNVETDKLAESEPEVIAAKKDINKRMDEGWGDRTFDVYNNAKDKAYEKYGIEPRSVKSVEQAWKKLADELSKLDHVKTNESYLDEVTSFMKLNYKCKKEESPDGTNKCGLDKASNVLNVPKVAFSDKENIKKSIVKQVQSAVTKTFSNPRFGMYVDKYGPMEITYGTDPYTLKYGDKSRGGVVEGNTIHLYQPMTGKKYEIDAIQSLIRHEFGHKIFNHNYTPEERDVFDKNLKESLSKPYTKNGTTLRDVNDIGMNASRGVDEAFADLFSKYTDPTYETSRDNGKPGFEPVGTPISEWIRELAEKTFGNTSINKESIKSPDIVSVEGKPYSRIRLDTNSNIAHQKVNYITTSLLNNDISLEDVVIKNNEIIPSNYLDEVTSFMKLNYKCSKEDSPDGTNKCNLEKKVTQREKKQNYSKIIDTPEFKQWFKDSKVTEKDGTPKMVFHGSVNPGHDTFLTDATRPLAKNETSTLGAWFTDNPKTAGEFARSEHVEYVTTGERWKSGELMQFPNYIQDFGGIYPVYLSLQNPKVYIPTEGEDSFVQMMNDRDEFASYIDGSKGVRGHWQDHMIATNVPETNKNFVDTLKKQGYDGIIIKNTMYDAPNKKKLIDQYVVFEPSQIKSVFNRKPTKSPVITNSSYLNEVTDFLKQNSNCKAEEKVGSGPGSCGGNNKEKSDNVSMSNVDYTKKLLSSDMSPVAKKEIAIIEQKIKNGSDVRLWELLTDRMILEYDGKFPSGIDTGISPFKGMDKDEFNNHIKEVSNATFKKKEFIDIINTHDGHIRLTPDGVELDVVRYQDRKMGGYYSLHGGVFYAISGNELWGNAPGFGGNSRHVGTIIFKNPFLVYGAEGMVIRNAYTAIVGREKASEFFTEAGKLSKLISSNIKPPEEDPNRNENIKHIKFLLDKHGGDSKYAETIYDTRRDWSKSGSYTAGFTILENVANNVVKKAGYDGIIGYNDEYTGQEDIDKTIKYAVTEIIDLQSGKYPDGKVSSNNKYYDDFYKKIHEQGRNDVIKENSICDTVNIQKQNTYYLNEAANYILLQDTSQKLNTNCKDSEKVGTGKGSCGGKHDVETLLKKSTIFSKSLSKSSIKFTPAKTVADAEIFAIENILDPKEVERVNKWNSGETAHLKPEQVQQIKMINYRGVDIKVANIINKQLIENISLGLPRPTKIIATKLRKTPSTLMMMGSSGDLVINTIAVGNFKKIDASLEAGRKLNGQIGSDMMKTLESHVSTMTEVQKRQYADIKEFMKYPRCAIGYETNSNPERALVASVNHETAHMLDRHGKYGYDTPQHDEFKQAIRDMAKITFNSEYKYKLSSYGCKGIYRSRLPGGDYEKEGHADPDETFAELYSAYRFHEDDNIHPDVLKMLKKYLPER